MSKKQISLFEIRSELETISNDLYQVAKDGSSPAASQNAIDLLISKIQRIENPQFGVKFTFTGTRYFTRFFNTRQERTAFKMALMLCPCCDLICNLD